MNVKRKSTMKEKNNIKNENIQFCPTGLLSEVSAFCLP